MTVPFARSADGLQALSILSRESDTYNHPEHNVITPIQSVQFFPLDSKVNCVPLSILCVCVFFFHSQMANINTKAFYLKENRDICRK